MRSPSFMWAGLSLSYYLHLGVSVHRGPTPAVSLGSIYLLPQGGERGGGKRRPNDYSSGHQPQAGLSRQMHPARSWPRAGTASPALVGWASSPSSGLLLSSGDRNSHWFRESPVTDARTALCPNRAPAPCCPLLGPGEPGMLKAPTNTQYQACGFQKGE